MSIVIDIDLWADIKWCRCKNVSDVSLVSVVSVNCGAIYRQTEKRQVQLSYELNTNVSLTDFTPKFKSTSELSTMSKSKKPTSDSKGYNFCLDFFIDF
jgi:hypothetical protein